VCGLRSDLCKARQRRDILSGFYPTRTTTTITITTTIAIATTTATTTTTTYTPTGIFPCFKNIEKKIRFSFRKNQQKTGDL